MTYKIKKGRKLKAVKIYKIKNMLPKKYRKDYDVEIKGDNLHLIRKEK